MKRASIGILILCVQASAAVAEEIALPFEIESTQSAILVRGSVDGKSVVLILDTGASRTVLARELMRLGPQRLAASSFSSDGPGLLANGRYIESTLELGGRIWRNRVVVAMSMAQVSKAFGRRIDGLIGQDLLREFDRVTIDFSSGRVQLSKGTPAPSQER